MPYNKGIKLQHQNAVQYIVMPVVRDIDAFTRQAYRDLFIESLNFCISQKGLVVYAYMIWTNHVRLVAQAAPGVKMSDIMRDLKRFTSKKIEEQLMMERETRREWMLYLMHNTADNHVRNRSFQFWVHGSNGIPLLSDEEVQHAIIRTHRFPVLAGVVDKPEEWRYSSARDYNGGSGLVIITRHAAVAESYTGYPA